MVPWYTADPRLKLIGIPPATIEAVDELVEVARHVFLADAPEGPQEPPYTSSRSLAVVQLPWACVHLRGGPHVGGPASAAQRVRGVFAEPPSILPCEPAEMVDAVP